MTRFLTGLLLGLLPLAIGCGDALPQVNSPRGAVVPNTAPPMRAKLESGPSETTSVEDEAEDPGECLHWVTELEMWNDQTGEFEYLYTCPEGGDIESVHSVGVADLAGNATYSDTYTMRDGSQAVWSWTVTLNAAGDGQNYVGTSTEGDSAEIEQVYRRDGSVQSHEAWTYADGGVYIVDGVYAAMPDVFSRERFNGLYTYDDPDTLANPDWTVAQSHDTDGTVTQNGHSVWDNWISDYVYTSQPDGSVSYDYAYDDLSTDVDPDFTGDYFYGVDGESHGGYTQLFDDDSVLVVNHSFNWFASAYSESWTFDDGLTHQPLDQEGAMDYDEDGNGHGTITTYVVGGDPETCDVSISAAGTTIIDNCR